jgi:hypothetical protein
MSGSIGRDGGNSDSWACSTTSGGGLGQTEVSVATSSDSRTSSAPGPPATRIGRTTTVAAGPSLPIGPQTVSVRPVRSTASTTSATGRPSTTGRSAASTPSERARALAHTGAPPAAARQ